MQLATDKESQHSSALLKNNRTEFSTCHHIAFSFILLHPVPGSALILNINIIPSLEKFPVEDGASGKISHIYGASIFC